MWSGKIGTTNWVKLEGCFKSFVKRSKLRSFFMKCNSKKHLHRRLDTWSIKFLYYLVPLEKIGFFFSNHAQKSLTSTITIWFDENCLPRIKYLSLETGRRHTRSSPAIKWKRKQFWAYFRNTCHCDSRHVTWHAVLRKENILGANVGRFSFNLSLKRNNNGV